MDQVLQQLYWQPSLQAKVLVCALGNRFDDLLQEDSQVYPRYYRETTTAVLATIQALLGRLEQKYDIVHVLCDATKGVIIDGSGAETSGTELIQRCCDQNVKLLWVANDSPAEAYIKGVGARGKRICPVFTLECFVKVLHSQFA